MSQGKKSEGQTRSGMTRRLVLTGLLFALALVLAAVENALPPLPIPIPGVKLGLSNIAVMYALFFLDRGRAYTIAALKAVFVFSIRGFVAGILSLSGGLLSVTVMVALMAVFKDKVSYLTLSIGGAVSHNIGQFIAIALIYAQMSLWAYLPVLLIAGIVAGAATAALLKFIIPALNKLA